MNMSNHKDSRPPPACGAERTQDRRCTLSGATARQQGILRDLSGATARQQGILRDLSGATARQQGVV